MRTEDSLARYLPHGDAMVYLGELLECDEESCLCTASFDAENPFARDGLVRSYITVEAAAQAIAVHEGVNRGGGESSSQESKIGYLVALSDLELHQPHVPVGEEFEIAVQRGPSVPGLATYEVHVALAGAAIATASLKTFVAP